MGTDFRGAILHGTIFNGCDLTQSLFDDEPNFTRATTGRTTFQTAVVPFAILGKNWAYLDLTLATITGIPDAIPKLVADYALLPDNLDLQNTDFTCPDGTGASFRSTRMYGIQLQGANLQGAQLQGARVKSAQFDGANLTLADLTAAWLIVETATPTTPVSELEAASLIETFMFNTVLDQAHCDGVDFTGAFFSTSLLSTQPASAEGAFMNDAKFNDAWVLGAIFNGAQLAGANFANAQLIGSRFNNNGCGAHQVNPVEPRRQRREHLPGRHQRDRLHRGQHGLARHDRGHRHDQGRFLREKLHGLPKRERAGGVHLRPDCFRQYHVKHKVPRRQSRPL